MAPTIARRLEEDRLGRRARQIERAMSALKDHAIHRHPLTGTTPPELQRAIADFGTELEAIRRHLAGRD